MDGHRAGVRYVKHVTPASDFTRYDTLSVVGFSEGDSATVHQTDGLMAKGKVFQHYKKLSREDQRTFDRWLTANAVVGLILAAGLVAMAFAGLNSVAPRDAVMADGTKAPDAVASEQVREQTSVSSTRKLTVRDK